MTEFLINLDGNILLWIQDFLRNDVLTPFFTFITSLGNGGTIWIIFTAILIFYPKTRKIGLMCACALIFSHIVNNTLLKNLVCRTRPFDNIPALTPLIERPSSFSFPSGHTASSFTCAWVLFKKLPKKLGVPAILLAALIGFSRLYLGVHYPSDVLAGMLGGILMSCLAFVFVEKIAASGNRCKGY
ncbi:MAG: phosphatase PAP2 family protein [Lachnospiraceae bacterium]|nr:phosphatase PAP2 family protein [Lachnospiraceae bacterium]